MKAVMKNGKRNTHPPKEKTKQHHRLTEKQKKMTLMRGLINFVLIFAGMISVIVFLNDMQRQYSMLRNEQAANYAQEAVIRILDENTEKVALLKKRYHEDNQAVMEDIVHLLT